MSISPNALSSLIAASALAILGAGFPAAAETPAGPQERVSVEVSVADLDLSSEAGARVAVGRIKSAAREVCRDAAPRSLLAPRARHECERLTVAKTIAEIGGDRPMLAALDERQ